MLYKYRGIKEFRNFVDIILRNRLFAANYFDLNDPMEGHYLYPAGELDVNVRERLREHKNETRICSLSRIRDNELMWAHYSEGHRGVVIGLEINRGRYDTRPVIYNGLAFINNNIDNYNTAREILCHKLEVWNYEQEERVFVNDVQFIDVQVQQVITGRAMSNQNFGFIRDLIQRINPEIELIRADNFM